MNLMLVNSLSARTKVYAGLGYGNRVGASIGTLAQTNVAGAAPGTIANSPVNNNGVASSNNAVVFGVAHSF
jgi:hypothetical protein